MKWIKATPEDEYQHTPLDNPLWREGYHVNGVDTEKEIGITISVGIRPALKMKEEVAAVHKKGDTLLHLNVREVAHNALSVGVTMEPEELFKKWHICVKDSFKKVEKGNPSPASKKVECNLHFVSSYPVCRYATERGNRYEQPGILKGEIILDDSVVPFKGNSIRDHSWELRDMTLWDEWYSFMGQSRERVFTLAYMKQDDALCEGWISQNQDPTPESMQDTYSSVRTIQVDPTFSNDILKYCTLTVETDKESLQLNTKVVSFISLPMGGIVETLVKCEEGGYGILWYGR